MMKKTYIAIVGKMASGKEIFGSILREELASAVSGETRSYPRVLSHRFSDPLNMILDILHIPKERAHQQKLSTVLREAFGEEVIGNALQKLAEADQAEIIFFDGVRRPQDVAMFRGFSNSYLVAIEAPAEIRFERLKKRNDRPGDANKTWEEFLAENNAESESKIEEIAKEADATIDNSGTLDALRKQIRSFLEKKIGLAL